jgi:hypothetical protein
MAITQTPAADASAPSHPAALLDDLKKLNFIRLAERNPSYDTLKCLGLEFLISVTGDKLAETKELKERQKTLGDTDPMMGKVLAATKDIYDEKVASGELPQGRSWSEFCEEKLDKKPDQMGRASQCMRCFRRLVMGGYLSEADYDVIATEWFTYTSKILDLATADGKEIKDSPVMQDVIAVLRTRPKDGAKRLRLIRNQLEGKETVSQDGKGPELDEKNFLAILERGLAKGYHGIAMTTVINAVTAWDKLPEETARQFFFGCEMARNAWDDTAAPLDDWLREKETKAAKQAAATKPVEIISPEIWLDRQGQHFTDTDKAGVIIACTEFVKRFNRYPENLLELADSVTIEEPVAA